MMGWSSESLWAVIVEQRYEPSKMFTGKLKHHLLRAWDGLIAALGDLCHIHEAYDCYLQLLAC